MSWSAVMDEAVWARKQIRGDDMPMDIEKALQIADHCNDEGIISTSALALRCLAAEYRKLKEADRGDLPHIEFLRNQLGNPK